MSQFIARVELHNGMSEDYEKLHAVMTRAGFSRTIWGSDGVTYHPLGGVLR
jgi:hypothetical protein